MIALNKRELRILAATLVLAFIFIINQFLIKPFQNGGVDYQAQILLKEKQLLLLNQSIRQDELLRKRRSYLEGLYGVNDNENVELSSMLSLIESTAAEAGIHVNNMQPQGADNNEGLRTYKVEAQFNGAWQGLVKFFLKLQNKPNNLFINEFSIERNGDTDSLVGKAVFARLRMIKN